MNSEVGPTAGLIGDYHMNEGSGPTLIDSSGTNSPGAPVGGPSWVAGAPALGGGAPSSNFALQFNGTSQYVTFGTAAGLGASSFTLEAWIDKTGNGTALSSTGTNGLSNYTAILAKGRNENDGSTVDMNYFLGIDAAGHIGVDFEDKNSTNTGSGDGSGLNHAFATTTTVGTNAWHHIAATYDTSNGLWKVYIDGGLDATSAVQTTNSTPGNPIALPQNNSVQHASLGSALNSTGATGGFFQGMIDEARIWNTVRSGAQISASMNTEIGPTTGLVGLYHLNEGTSTTTGNSAGVTITGNLSPSGTPPAWVAGAPALGTGGSNQAPDAPVVVSPNDGATGVSQSPNLDVTVNDADGNPMDVTFYGRPVAAALPGDFTIGVLPDTQFYAENVGNGPTGQSRFQQYLDQTNWLVSSQAQLNTLFVTHLGDITQNFDTIQAEWVRADQAQNILDNAGLPNSVTTGNHDINSQGNATYYDQYFPPSRYSSNSWYGGYMGDPNDNIAESTNRLNKDNYELFDVGSLKFLFISLEVDMPQYSIDWAQNVINAYPDRQVMITTHAFLNPSAQRPTSTITGRPDHLSAAAVWTQLIFPNCNIFLVINGHYHGEANRVDNNACNKPVNQVVVDYQDFQPGGGNGWLRYMTFRPALNQIDSYSYSPTLDQSFTDANSQFSMPFDMGSNPIQTLGVVHNVASGGHAVLPWTSLASGSQYEWYAVADDGIASTQGSTSVFTTSGSSNQPPVMDSVTINQASPHTNDTLTSTVAGHDPEGASVTYSYEWLRNGSAISGATSSSLNLSGANNGNKGDQISLRVRASDGTLQSAPMTSSSVTILNTAPTATVSLNTSTPQDNTTLTATATRSDADNDTVTLTYVWRVNGTTRKTTSNSSSLTDTFDLSVAGNGDSGDQVTVTVTPSDGTASGTPVVATANIGATNTPPVANDQDVLVERNVAAAITLTATDANGDPITFTVLSNPAHGTLTGTGAGAHLHAGQQVPGQRLVHVPRQRRGRQRQHRDHQDHGREGVPAPGQQLRVLEGEPGREDRLHRPLDQHRVGGAPRRGQLRVRALRLGLDRRQRRVRPSVHRGRQVGLSRPDHGRDGDDQDPAGRLSGQRRNVHDLHDHVGRHAGSRRVRLGHPDQTPLGGVDQLGYRHERVERWLHRRRGNRHLQVPGTAAADVGRRHARLVARQGHPSRLEERGTPAMTPPVFANPLRLLFRRSGVAVLVTAMLAGVLPLGMQVAHAAGNNALQFDGSNDYATFGQAAGLGATSFTLETWFMRTGAGVTVSTGTLGLNGTTYPQAIPLLTKGRGEADGSNVDMNWFLGITDPSDATLPNRLAVDFEDKNSTTNNPNPPAADGSGLNHPFVGSTVVTTNVWHHAAATYDSTTGIWHLYLDGNPDGTSPVMHADNTSSSPIALPQDGSIQHAAIGTAMQSGGVGTQAGFFAGQIDEPRVWNTVRSQAQIQAGMNTEIGATAGLLGAWHLNEGSGTSMADVSGNGIVGTLGASSAAPTWVAGAPALDPPPPPGNYALQFNGTSQYVTFGQASGLGASSFTLEAWIDKTGNGTPLATTGTSGLANYTPILAKGRDENDGSTVDMNYFLGIDAAGHIGVDFEDKNSTTGGTGDGSGLNHAFSTTTTLANNAWHHVAATYDTSNGLWKIYIDGGLNLTSPVQTANTTGSPIALPQNASIQHASLGSALNSTGVASGFFQGMIDEARIWNTVRSEAQISASMNTEITSPTAGLLGRWGLNEGYQGTAGDTVGTAGVSGTLTNGPTWVAGAPALNAPPPPLTNPALSLNGTSQYATFGAAPALGVSSFTLEAWVDRTGAGVALPTTGTGGLTNFTPLIAKGRNELDGSTVDMNFFLGIDATGHIGVDFEDKNSTTGGAGDGSGLNHPYTDATHTVPTGAWHHVAATYDTSTGLWKIYIDGALTATSPVQTADTSGNPIALPQNNSIQHASIGSALDSTGAASGYFAGAVDEARIWDFVRSQAQISATMNSEIATATGLIGRWGMNEQSGNTIADTAGSLVTGTLPNGAARVEGPVLSPPASNDPPVMDSAVIDQSNPTTNQTLTTTVSGHDPNSDPLTYTYQWIKNGSDISGATGASLDMSVPGRGDKGDQISVRVVAHDPFVGSAPLTSSAVTVVNSPPAPTVGLNNSSPGTNDTLTATTAANDPDAADTPTFTYQWRVNGTLRKTTSNTASTTDTFDLSQSSNGNTGDTIEVSVTANDGTVTSSPAVASATVVDALKLPNFNAEQTWQTNDRVIAIERVGNVVYLGGKFTQVRDHSGTTATRNRLAAFDALTGNLLPWNPNANGVVWSLDSSADGSTIYVSGAFKKVGGASHQRVAAVDATGTGSVDVWNPFVDAVVRAVTVSSGGTVYIGGNFATVNGTNRTRLAALNGTTGDLLPWAPAPNNLVRALDLDQTGRVIVGGSFTTVGASAQNRIAILDPTSGTPAAFAGPRPTDVVTDIAVGDDADSFYVTFNNVVNAYTSATGARRWTEGGDGNVQGLDVQDGVLYIGGHFHVFNNLARVYLASMQTSNGTVTPWTAHANSILGVFAVEATTDRLYIGGDFTQVSGNDQQGFAMFKVQDNTQPTRPGKPSGVSNTSSSISLTWDASFDAGNPSLDYEVYRDSLPGPIAVVTSSSTTTVNYTDTGLSPLSMHTYQIRATDGQLFSSFSDVSDPITVQNGADGAAPNLTGLSMLDQDHDGRIDRVVATFSETLAAYTAGNAPWTLTNVPSGGTLASVSVAGTQATLTITEGAGAQNTAVGSFRIALAANPNGIRDAAGNQTSFAAIAPSDDAAPVPINLARKAGSGNGLMQPGDQLKITFSEPIRPASVPNTVTVTESDPSGAGNDLLAIAGIISGTMDLGSNAYVGADGTSASFANSGVALGTGGTLLKVTVGATCSGGGCASLGAGGKAALTYVPAAALTDAAFNAATGQNTKTFRMF